MELREMIAEAVAYLEGKGAQKPELAIVLGSGLGAVAQRIQVTSEFAYADIPHFNPSSAPTHAGKLLFGTLEGRAVVCMQGRIHLYEGYEPQQVVFGTLVMHALGAQQIIFTNATGGIRADLKPGDIVAVTDHINFTGRHAFTLNPGLGKEEGFTAFVDLTNAYDPALIARAHAAAEACGVELKEGVYVGTHGPELESPAEIRAYRTLGADVVGMSTVLEAVAARSVGMQVLCLSFVSNYAAGLSDQKISDTAIFELVARSAENMAQLISAYVAQ